MGWMGWFGLACAVVLLVFHKRLLSGPNCKACGDDLEKCLHQARCPLTEGKGDGL